MGHAWIYQASEDSKCTKENSQERRYHANVSQGDTMQMYHKQLSAILAALATHTDKLKNDAISFTNKVQYFDIVCPILYIIADTEGADKFCRRYGSHNLKIQQHCRMCDLDSANLDNKEYNCTYLRFSNMHSIAMSGTDEQRQMYSQHEVTNAFYNINFGGQEYGLLRYTPPDILHVVRKV